MLSSLNHYLALLATYLKPQWPRALLMVMFLLASIGLQLLNPQILRAFIDTAMVNGASRSLVIIGILFIGAALANQAVSVMTSYLSTNVAWTATNQLRHDLVAHCLALDMGFHKMRTAGELIERIDGDVDALSNFFSQFVISLLGSFIMLAAMIVLYFGINWRVGVAMSIFSLISLWLLMTVRRRAVPLWTERRQVTATFFGFLSEYLAGIQDIRANGAVAYVMRRFYGVQRLLVSAQQKAWMAGAFMGSSTLLLFIFGSVLALTLGAYLWSIKAISLGTVYLIFSYTDILSRPIRQIQIQLQDLQQAEACIRRVDELLQTRSTLDNGPGLPLPQGMLAAEFCAISFGYTENDPIIHDLTLSVAPGKILGVVGHTGSGKTTLARLLFRLYDPQRGEVRVGGIDVRSAHVRDLRRRIGLVTQDVQIFRATVRDNVTFFDRSIPDTRIGTALEEVGLSAWYRQLPRGLDTMLGAGGEGVSAGEAQLLAFTRVFLANPGLIILDEASSRLDPATETLIELALDRLLSGRTAMVIAHRLATLKRADDIVILQNGRIAEYGERTVLASDPSSRLFQLLQTGLEEVNA